MRIQINTERVREVGNRLLAEAEAIHNIGTRLNSAVYDLDTWAWDGVSRSRAEPLLEQVRPQADYWSQELQRLGQTLQHVAKTFEEQDAKAAQELGGLSWVGWDSGSKDRANDLGSVFADMWGVMRSIITVAGITGVVNFLADDVELSIALLESRDVAKGLKILKGHSYPGQLIFHGNSVVKKVAGFSPYLTHVKFNLFQTAKGMGKDAFWEGLGIGSSVGLAMNIVTVGVNGFENWEKYREEGVTKVAAGVVVDSVMDIGLSAAGAGIGAWGGALAGGALLGAVSGGVLAPVGAAIGSKVGGFAGSVAGGWVSDKLKETDIHEVAVDWTADRFDDAYEIGSDVVDTIGESIQKGVQKVDQALDSAIDELIKLF